MRDQILRIDESHNTSLITSQLNPHGKLTFNKNTNTQKSSQPSQSSGISVKKVPTTRTKAAVNYDKLENYTDDLTD